MTPSKKKKLAIAICIQEPVEDGSSMNLGAIEGADLRFLHQAFITDTINHSLGVTDCDVRLYYIDDPDRMRLVKIVTDYVAKKQTGKNATDRFQTFKMDRERWGIRIEKIFKDCFAQGYNSVLLIGSRTPTISAPRLDAALKVLDKSDAVFGPTPEGRYYVIGMSGQCHINISDFDWKSPSIYSEVSAAFTEKDLRWSELEIWYAVEAEDALDLMARDINQFRFEGDEYTARETELVMERLISKLES